MSTRAMAQHFSSGGGSSGRNLGGNLDLLGLRERKSNRMADADLQRQLQLMKLAEELARETDKQKGEQDTSNKKSEYSHQKSIDSLIAQGIVTSKEAFNGLPQTVQDHLVKQQNNKSETLSTNSEVDKNFAASDMGKRTREFGQAGLNTMPGMQAIKEGTTTLRENETARMPSPWDLTTFGVGSGMAGNKQSTEFKEVFNPQTMKMEMRPSGVSTTTMTPGKFPVGKIDLSAELGLAPTAPEINPAPDVSDSGPAFPAIMNNGAPDLNLLRIFGSWPQAPVAPTLNPAPNSEIQNSAAQLNPLSSPDVWKAGGTNLLQLLRSLYPKNSPF
jgi:hypothetical protein